MRSIVCISISYVDIFTHKISFYTGQKIKIKHKFNLVYKVNNFTFVPYLQKMKRLITTTLLLAIFTVNAQVKISGRITDNRNKPLSGVNFVLKNTYDGATSDSSGVYSFITGEKGAQQLEASFTGYNSILQNISISLEPIVRNISLKEQITELKAVVISAGSFEASDKNKGAVLSIDIVTTPSANGDITSAFKSLPGTQQLGESGGLFVRGGVSLWIKNEKGDVANV